ncbi:MAG: DUF1850 domain-containing protein [Pyrobaculum sp.]|jgi:hypothetical protein|nr:DUF1850 domain-containing protein [Pyrobaculum sp.]
MFFLYLVVFIFPNTTLLFLPPVNVTIQYIHSVEKTTVVEKLEVRSTGVYLLYADYGGACGYGIPCRAGDTTTGYLGRSVVMYCDPVNMCTVTTPGGSVNVVGVFAVGAIKLNLFGPYGK